MESLFLSLVFLALGIEGFGFIESIVCPAVTNQLFGILAIHGFAVALAVGAVVAADMDTFVEFDAQPVEGFDNIVFGTGDKAGLVGVLNSQNHVASVLAGEQIVIQSRADSADVERASGAGSETYAYFSH